MLLSRYFVLACHMIRLQLLRPTRIVLKEHKNHLIAWLNILGIAEQESVTAFIIESVMRRKQSKPLFHWNLILLQLLTYLQTSLFLMDTEGTGNSGKDAGGRQNKLLATALTVSSLVIYNVDGYLQANDLENVAVWFHNSIFHYAMCNLGKLLYLAEIKTCSTLPDE